MNRTPAPAPSAAHTPTPWAFGNACGRFSLYAPHHGILLILDAVRSGMNGAQLRVAIREGTNGGVMRPVSELESPETHPDLAFIVTACNDHARLIERVAELEAALASIIDSAHDNASELAGRHMRELGVTTIKNKHTAELLVAEIRAVQDARAVLDATKEGK